MAEQENDSNRDWVSSALFRGADVSRRLRLRKLSRRLSAMQTQRWLVARHAGRDDDEENARTTPPEEEHIELHSIWMVEAFPPSSSASLGKALRRLPEGSIFRDEDLADEVARARRFPLGGWWWNVGVLYNDALRGQRIGGGYTALPGAIDHMFLSLYLLTPSLICAVAQFVVNDEGATAIESIVRQRYSTEGVRKRSGAVSVRSPLIFKRELVAAKLDELHDGCKGWFQRYLPGAFCGGLLEGSLPACFFLTLDQLRPFSEEARVEYLDPLGLQAGFSALESDDLPGLRLSEPTGVKRRPHTFLLAGKKKEVFPNDAALGGHPRGRGGYTVALEGQLNKFIATWGLERVLLGYEMAFGRLRDSFAAAHPKSIRKNLSSLEVASKNVATLGGDAHAVAVDAQRLVREQRMFGRELVTFKPAEPEMWRLQGTWTDAFRDDITRSAERLGEVESAARDLEVTRASILSSRTNLGLQISLVGLTIFLVVLTVVLALLGWATLDAMDSGG